MHANGSLNDFAKGELYAQLLNSINKRFDATLDDLSHYQNDPVGFAGKVLGETFTDDVRRLLESVRDNPVTIAQSANATGKTHAAARVAVWFYKCFAGAQGYTAAAPPENNLKRLLWGAIGSIIEGHPDLFAGNQIKSLQVATSAQHFLCGVTIPMAGTEAQREAKFSGKHAPCLLFIIDEGDAVPDAVYRGIESCMSGGHARMLVMFNPRAESGEVYRMARDGRANVVKLSAFSHPNVISGRDEIPGAVTRETTVRRINEWCRPLAPGEVPGNEGFDLPAFLEGQIASSQSGQVYPPLQAGWYKIMEPAFSYMVLGEYPAQASTQLISREWISRARSRWDSYVSEHGEVPPQVVSAVLGLDVGEFGTDANVACFRYGHYVERPISWGGVDTTVTADRAVEEFNRRNTAVCQVDATGVGAGVAPLLMRSGCPAVAVKVASSPTMKTELGEFNTLRDQLWWAAREWLRTDQAMLPPDEMLLEELRTPTYEVRNGKIRVMDKATMRELLKRSPDRADALCLTFNETGFFAGCKF